jgi:glucose/arabinose dehydrogenase/mono/diheme cytochrome c family protein
MKKGIYCIPAILFLVVVCSCNSGKSPDTIHAFSNDSLSISRGEKIFSTNCSNCHNFRSDGIGPQLGGITASVSDAWILHFISNPKAAIDAGDSLAHALFEKFHTVMPSFAIADSQAHDLLNFLHTKKAHKSVIHNMNLKEVVNPVSDSIKMSQIRISLEPVVKIPPSSPHAPFTRINKIEFVSAGKKYAAYVLDMRGKLYVLKNKQPKLYLDLAALEPGFLGEPGLGTGFGSFAFHPEFRSNGLLYTTHTEPSRSQKADFSINDSIKTALQWVLTEWKATSPGAAKFAGSHRELLRIDMVAGMHGVQEITFNPGAKPGGEDYGQLYIGVGDGGCVENGFPFLAHQTNKVWGSVLRIDPLGSNSTNGKYGISGQNPFVNDHGKLQEIYAYGFRNPNRITWSKNGQMLVSNIGQTNIESLNIVGKGHDFGWPLREGPFVLDYDGDMKRIYSLPANDSSFHFTYPALLYDHDEGNAISGGYEYTGTNAPVLNGKYVFGDIVSGRLFFADMKDLKPGHPALIRGLALFYRGKPATLRSLCGDQRVDLRFAKDNRGEMYILTKSDGMIYRINSARVIR